MCMCMCMCIYRVFPETPRPRGPKPQLNRDLIVRILAVLYDLYIYIYVCMCICMCMCMCMCIYRVFPETQRPRGPKPQLNHDLIVYVRHMGKALHDAIEQLNQDLICLDVGGCQGAGTGQLTQELIFFNSWINCLPAV